MTFFKKIILPFLSLFIATATFDTMAMFTVPRYKREAKPSPQAIHNTKKALKTASAIESAEQAQLEAKTQIIRKQRSKQCYDLAIVVDDLGEETDKSKVQTVNDDFLEALKRKKFPIIVSNTTVWNVCESYYRFGGNPEHGPLTNDWYCYDHPGANIMLFVPKGYIENFASLQHVRVDFMQKCGFDTTHLKTIENVSARGMMRYFWESGKRDFIDFHAAKFDFSPKRDVLPTVEAIESMLIKPTQPNSPTWNILLVGHGGANTSIAGLAADNFYQLLDVFQNIHCSILCYNSCESGGTNLIQTTKVLEQLKVNFIVVNQGINESGAETSFRGKFEDFFTRAESFFGNSNTFAQTKTSFLPKDPIAWMINPLIQNTGSLMYNQPFVYIPAVGVFNALAVDKQIKIMTHAILKSYAFENRMIDCTNPDIKAIMMYAPYVDSPIKIGSHSPCIVSPTTHEKMDLHIFEEMIHEGTLPQLLYRSLFGLNLKHWPVTFIIKKLQCLNNSNLESGKESEPINLENIVVYCSGMDNKNDIAINVLLSCNKKNYALNPHIIKYDYNQVQKFVKVCLQSAQEKVNFIAIQHSDFMNHVPTYLRQLIGIQNVLNKDITLTDIIHGLESHIDKSTLVQKPGSLKKILLNKQKDQNLEK